MGLMVETSSRKEHWDAVYRAKGEAGVSWFQEDPRLSLQLIRSAAPADGGRIIDVGGGVSVLVERLLELPFEQVASRQIQQRVAQQLGRWEPPAS